MMSKSIEGYTIFHNDSDYSRMVDMIRFFMYEGHLPKFSVFRARIGVQRQGFASYANQFFADYKRKVDIISFCLMPTHLHLVLRQRIDEGISKYMSDLLNTYTRYFNVKRKRHGPLWTGRFKSVHVSSDKQLLHLTRYVHLNPSTAGIVKKPDQWQFSSYSEFASPEKIEFPLCTYEGLLDMKPKEYASFVTDYAVHQKELAIIKHLVLE
ncbi:MAG: transposase [Candidatus Andersenbacteria bacterium]|nr:transposase [Candidatus Andersenbacteria bacterium]